MKTKRKTVIRTLAFIVMILLVSSSLFGCMDKKPEETAPGSDTLGGPGLSSASSDASERAMENFLSKLEAGDYVIDCEDNLIRATVFSDDLVYYNLNIRDGENTYDGFALMTVNGTETFMGYLGEESVDHISFAGEGKAFDLAKELELPSLKSKLPNHWIDAAEGNIWNLFYNDPENALRFSSSGDELKLFAQMYAGIGDMAMPRMQEVYLELDAEDPAEAHVRTSFSEGYPAIKDVDIVITFGGAETDARAEAWMNDPDREYPEARTEWGAEVVDLNAVFLPGYGEKAVPFPDFATYAFMIDISRILSDDLISIRDCRATEEDMERYAEKLEKEGFKAVEEDGRMFYRLMLREEYKCWSSIELEYENGARITAKKYYDLPKYEGRDAINAELGKLGYPELPGNDHISGYSAVDTAYELTEGWLYLFDYESVMYADFRYDDRTAAEDYLYAYVGSLEGFVPDASGEEDEYDEAETYLGEEAEIPARFTLLRAEDEDVYYRLRLPTGMRSFKYRFNEDGETVSLLFKSEKYVPAEDVDVMLAEAGFPEVDLGAYELCRDLVKFGKTMFGQDYDLDLFVSLKFGSPADAEAFLDSYIGDLRDGSFDITNPGSVSMNRTTAYSKESGDKLLVFGFDYKDGWDMTNLEFRIMEIPEEW